MCVVTCNWTTTNLQFYLKFYFKELTSLPLCIFQNQLLPASKGTYREYLGKLDLQYSKLLVSVLTSRIIKPVVHFPVSICCIFLLSRTPPSPV